MRRMSPGVISYALGNHREGPLLLLRLRKTALRLGQESLWGRGLLGANYYLSVSGFTSFRQ